MMAIALLWIIVAGCVGGIAELNGRRVSLWFIIGLVFGLLAVAIVLVAPNVDKEDSHGDNI